LTEPDEELLRYASLVADMFEWSDVHFTHVLAVADSGDAPDPQPSRIKLEADVDRAFARSAASRPPSLHVAHGSRLDALLGLAVRHERDVIMLGHRRTRSGRRSLARRLAMLAPSSVWLVPEGSPPRINSILVPTDFSQHSADALSVAVDVARAAGLKECRAVHVFFDPSTVRYDEHVEEVVGREETAFEEFLAGVDTHGIRVEPILRESTHPGQAILRVAENCGSDLIVMNTRGRSHTASLLLGSVTSDAMAGTTVPLLAVKHYGSHMTALQAILNHRFWDEKAPKSN